MISYEVATIFGVVVVALFFAALILPILFDSGPPDEGDE